MRVEWSRLNLLTQYLSRHQGDLLLIAVYLGLPFLFYYNLFTSHGFWGVGDAMNYYVPNRMMLANSLSSLELPLWNQSILSGYPFMADIQSAVFYPLNVLIFGLLPINLAYNFDLLLHISLAGIFTYLYLKQMGLLRAVAFLGGVVFMFSAPFCQTKSHLTIQNAIVWLPAILWMYEKYLKEHKKALLIGAAIFFSLQIFAGFPQISLYTLLVLGFYSMASRRRHINWVRDICLFFVVVTGLSLMQVLPTFELARYVGRTHISYETFTSYSMSFYNLITLFFPYFFGSYAPDTPVPFYHQSYWGPGHAKDPYIGIIPLVLAAYGIFAHWRCSFYVKIWTAITVVALLIAMGGHIPFLAHLLYHIPVINSFRVPMRFLSFFSFGLVTLFALGLNEYILRAHDRNYKNSVWKFYLLCTVFVSIIVVLLTQNNFLLRAWLEYFHKINPGGSMAFFQQALALTSPQMMVPFLTFLAGFGVLYFLSRVSPGTVKRYGIYLVFLVIFCDLHITLFFDLFNKYSEFTKVQPGIDLIHNTKSDTDRIYPIITADAAELVFMEKLNFGPNVNSYFHLDSVTGYVNFSPVEYREILGMNERGSDYSGNWHSLLLYPDILSLLNTRYVIVPEKYKAMAEEIVKFTGHEYIEGTKVASISGVSVPPQDDFKRYALWSIPVPDLKPNTWYKIGVEMNADVSSNFYVDFFGKKFDSPYLQMDFVNGAQKDLRYEKIFYSGEEVPADVKLRIVNLSDQEIDVKSLAVQECVAGAGKSFPPYVKVYEDSNHTIYKNRCIFPKMFALQHLKPWEKDVRQLLMTDLSQIAYLSENEASIPKLMVSGKKAEVEVTEYKSGKAQAKVFAPTDTFLVLSESYFPGWKAYVDGKPVKVYKVNGMVQGVLVPAGHHMVKFVYLPDSFLIGLTIHMGTVAALLFFLLVSRRIVNELSLRKE